MNKKPIYYLFRSPLPQFNSIEGVFRTIIDEVSKSYLTKTFNLTKTGGNPLSLMKNCLFFVRDKKSIYHITGDIHYMACVTGKKTLLTIHDVGSACYGSFLKQIYLKFFWFWLPALLVKRITVISEFSKKELVKLIPFAKHKIKVVYNPVKEELIYFPKIFNTKNPKILLIGTKPNKNIENTIKSLEGITCELHIIGKLTEQQLVLLKQLGIKYRNQFFIPDIEIKKAYDSCDILSFASTYEGFGMPIIEAQAIGRPVITSDLGAMKEVAGVGACLVDPYSITSIRSGVEKLIKDEAYRANLIQQGLKNVKRFKLEKIANDYLKLYQELDS